MLLGAEGVELVFTDDAVQEIAAVAEELNTQVCAGWPTVSYCSEAPGVHG